MLKLTLVELFVRLLPECIALIFAGYAISGKKVKINRIIVSGIILTIAVYVIRMLPIHFGVHTILSVMVIMFLLITMNEIELIKSGSSAMLSVILLFILDSVVLISVTKLFNVSANDILNNHYLKIIALYPSLILFFLIILLLYFYKRKKASN